MPDYTLPLDTEMVNDIDTEVPPKTGRVLGAAVSAYDSLNSLIPDFAINYLRKEVIAKFNPGKMLSPKEYNDGPWKVEGISNPNGVPENLARYQYHLNRDFLIRQNTINNMEPGALSFLSRQAGAWALTLALIRADPVVMGVAKGATELTGKLMPWVLSKLTNTGARVATKFAVGAAEAATIGIPMTIAQHENLKLIGRDESALNVLASEGMFALGGGFLRVGLGWKKPFMSSEDHLRAKEAAINHISNGKPAYIEPILKNGLYQMSAESKPWVLKAEDTVRDLQPELEKIDQELAAKKSDLKETLESRKVGVDLAEEERGSEFIDRLDEVRKKPFDFRTEEESGLLKRFATPAMREKEPTILQKAHDISEKHEAIRTPEEQEFLDDFTGKKEEERIIQEADNLKTKRDQFKEEMDKTTSRDRKAKLRFKVSDFNDRISKNETRLNNLRTLDRLEKEDAETFNKRSDIKKLEAQRNIIKNHLDENKIYAQTMNANSEPLAKSDLENNTAWINDWKSDFAYSKPEFEALEREIESIPDNVDLDMENELNTVNDLREGGKLTDEEEEYLDSFDKEDGEFNTVAGALRDYIQCLLREGE